MFQTQHTKGRWYQAFIPRMYYRITAISSIHRVILGETTYFQDKMAMTFKLRRLTHGYGY